MRERKNVFVAMLMIAVLIAGGNNVLAFAHENDVKSNSDYQVYDMSTGEISYHFYADLESSDDEGFSPGYFPNGVSYDCEAGISVAAVVGDDDREEVTDTTVGPYSGIVYIEVTYEDRSVFWGTGFMIGL